MSARCPACTRPLEFDDLTLRTRLEGDVSTMGHVQLAEPSEMLGRLVCGQLTNTGRFEGRAVVYGQITLAAKSLTTGHLTGRSLRIDFGATARIKTAIAPTPPPETPRLEHTSARPVSNAARPTPPTAVTATSPIGRLIRRPARRLTRPLG